MNGWKAGIRGWSNFTTALINKGGSYGNKILSKNLKFFDKIFVTSKIS